jgi:putative ABC transport system ATP-binding protein
VISARGLKRSFDDGARGMVSVLDDVSLEVAKAEFVAVVGRSGSGKSTLLNVLGGLDTAYSGEVTVAGVRISGLSDSALSHFRNRHVGFVFQSFHLVPGLSALDNVLLPSLFGANATPSQRGREVLEQVGLGGKVTRLPSQLSGGERQRVAIARALLHSPSVLLCDEPTGNLDATTADEVIALFSSLNRLGLTVLAVTHETRLREAATRVVKLENGRLVSASGSTSAS